MPYRTAIVTWVSYRNFGTVLQAYALQRILKESGHMNRILDDSSIVSGFTKKRFSPLRFLRNRSWLFPSYARFRKHQEKVAVAYDTFKCSNMDIDHDWQISDGESIGYDIYIAGSDQIWSPELPFSEYYYLASVSGRKVAYAPSFGVSSISDRFLDKIVPFLKDFSLLSVREPAGALRLEETMGLKVEVVADPTLLIDSAGWNRLLGENGVDDADSPERYALCYLLTYNGKYVDYVKDYCRRNGFRLKFLVTNEKFMGEGDEDIYAGPLEFLDAVRKAEIVFTDSYHGGIFSILYRKDLLMFKRFAADSVVSQNPRVEYIVHRLGLDGRLVDETGLDDSWKNAAIDYDNVGDAVERFRDESMAYIRSIFERNDDRDMQI